MRDLITEVKPRRVVVVGAAGGMGAEIVRRFVSAGHAVAALDLAGTTASELAAVNLPIDLSDPLSVDKAMQDAAEALGGVDVLVNCAAILGNVIPSADVSYEEFSRVVSVNLNGSFALSQAALQRMLPQNFGRIIHIVSIAGKEGNPQMAAYSASKAGVIGLVKSLGREYAQHGVTVNAVAPGAIESPMMRELTPERQEYQKSLMPMRRFGTVQEIAALVSFIASDEASFTTGFVYDVSGGRATY